MATCGLYLWYSAVNKEKECCRVHWANDGAILSRSAYWQMMYAKTDRFPWNLELGLGVAIKLRTDIMLSLCLYVLLQS